MNEGFDLAGEETTGPISCNVKSPHATWSVFNIGQLSVLFSYGRPVGFSTPDRTFVRDKVKRATQKHLNAWQDFRSHQTISPEEFDAALLVEMQEALNTIQQES